MPGRDTEKHDGKRSFQEFSKLSDEIKENTQMLTDEEKKLIVGIIEDEMQIIDFVFVYSKHDQELMLSILEKLR